MTNDKDWRDSFPEFGYFGKYNQDDDNWIWIAIAFVIIVAILW